MIDVSDEDVRVERRTSGQRFALFCDTDLPTGSVIPWHSVMLDYGGDAYATLVRLDEARGPAGWTLLALLTTASERCRAEVAILRHSPLTKEAARQLGAALSLERERRGGVPEVCEVLFDPADPDSGWRWLTASFDDEVIELSPDVRGDDAEGLTLELLLLVADELVSDAAAALPSESAVLGAVGVHVARALSSVSRRDHHLRDRRRR